MIMHAKYQCSIINTSEDMSQVKVFVTDRQRDRRTDEWVLMSPAFAKGGGQKDNRLSSVDRYEVFDDEYKIKRRQRGVIVWKLLISPWLAYGLAWFSGLFVRKSRKCMYL